LSALAAAFLLALSLGPVFAEKPAPHNVAQPGVTVTTQATHPACASDLKVPEKPSLLSDEGGFCSAISDEGTTLGPGVDHHRHGYCRCSCGYPCTTSADCGGVSCDPFITCC